MHGLLCFLERTSTFLMLTQARKNRPENSAPWRLRLGTVMIFENVAILL